MCVGVHVHITHRSAHSWVSRPASVVEDGLCVFVKCMHTGWGLGQ